MDTNEIAKRVIKYLVEWLAIAIAAKFIPNQNIDVVEIVMISLVGATTFALLDMFAPQVGRSARLGTGLSLGMGMV
ncbi:MAG: hypothetical protein CMF62_00320 [Magnetococcales bacterium]|nr:hypothetical protein [Magnetococcales bacterium]|tara:strand:+ start:14709 stop:14936 length:228 start_codon:yes stop_codon:yes gene_type:complete